MDKLNSGRRHFPNLSNNSDQMKKVLNPSSSITDNMTSLNLDKERKNLPHLSENPINYGASNKLITFLGVYHSHKYDDQSKVIEDIIERLPSNACILLEGEEPEKAILSDMGEATKYGESGYAAYCASRLNLEFRFPESGKRQLFLSQIPDLYKVSNDCLHALNHFYRSKEEPLETFMSRAVENANAKFQVTPTPVTHADVKKEICEALGLDERNAYEQISLEKESLDKPILTSIRTELNPNSEALKSRISSFEKELSNDRERWLMKEIESIYKENRPCFIVYGYGHLQVNHNRLIEMTSY